MFGVIAVEGVKLFGESLVWERGGLLLGVVTELRGLCGGDSEDDVLLFAVSHGFGFSRETIEEGLWSRVGVTKVREEEGKGEDEGEATQESGK